MIAKEKSHLGASIVRTGRILINSINSHFQAIGTNITFEQLEVLIHIATNPEKKIIQTDLAILMQKNKSGVLRTIDVLEKKEYVKRTPVPGDRRKNVIEATEEGYTIAKAAIETFQKIEHEYMKKINKEDVLICTRVLDTIKNECRPSEAEVCETKKPTLAHI